MLKANRIKRQKRTRVKVRGEQKSPRLSVFRSNKYIFAQAIDDLKGKTIASIFEKDLKETATTKSGRAKKAGLMLAKKLKKAKITSIIFDRGAYKYHGRVKSFAEGLREGGLKF